MKVIECYGIFTGSPTYAQLAIVRFTDGYCRLVCGRHLARHFRGNYPDAIKGQYRKILAKDGWRKQPYQAADQPILSLAELHTMIEAKETAT